MAYHFKFIRRSGIRQTRSCARHENRVKKMNETSELKQFCDDVLKEFEDNITDAVFCYLQSDKELMRRYLLLMREYEKGKQTLNSQLAQAITREFGLKSTNQKNDTPNSVLIESFTELEERR
jgi:hypothetical protein